MKFSIHIYWHKGHPCWAIVNNLYISAKCYLKTMTLPQNTYSLKKKFAQSFIFIQALVTSFKIFYLQPSYMFCRHCKRRKLHSIFQSIFQSSMTWLCKEFNKLIYCILQCKVSMYTHIHDIIVEIENDLSPVLMRHFPHFLYIF